MRSTLRPPVVILPLPSIEQMQIRVVLARTPVPTVLHSVLKRPGIRAIFKIVRNVIRRITPVLLPRIRRAADPLSARGPPD